MMIALVAYDEEHGTKYSIGVDSNHIALIEEYIEFDGLKSCIIDYLGKEYIVLVDFNKLMYVVNGFSLSTLN